MGVDEIKSQGFSLKELFRDVAYQVDYYQRDYTWGEEEVRTLLRDLCTSFSHWSNDPALIRRPGNAPQYFLGPFVYYEQSKNRRCLVDGQQRFVTLHLLFLQLRARVRDHGDARRVDRLNRAITTDGAHFSIGISDHEPVLRAIDEGRVYETGLGDSLSRRNLWARSQQIEAQLAEELDADKLDRFTDWILDRVVMVGIRAANQDHGYRMFETMNDRGARLTAVDLLKSHLLANVGTGEDQLNTRWQETLRELATDREDPGAAARFIKATLLARYARPDHAEDRRQIDANLNVWVRQNAKYLGLVPDRPENFLDFVQSLLETARLFRPHLAASRALKKDGDRLEAVLFNERNGLGEQSVAILAAIRPTDPPSQAKDKGRLVAAYIDRWYALQVLQDLPVQAPEPTTQKNAPTAPPPAAVSTPPTSPAASTRPPEMSPQPCTNGWQRLAASVPTQRSSTSKSAPGAHTDCDKQPQPGPISELSYHGAGFFEERRSADRLACCLVQSSGPSCLRQSLLSGPGARWQGLGRRSGRRSGLSASAQDLLHTRGLLPRRC
ncbi:DUF262 domain-containing protein [Streptomyces malaysiensis]|uniref:DUF262 domain-containing protein n=1 Tax=Streptomyces malaysiensis TaxID=92644 RepID=UPI0034241824